MLLVVARELPEKRSPRKLVDVGVVGVVQFFTCITFAFWIMYTRAEQNGGGSSNPVLAMKRNQPRTSVGGGDAWKCLAVRKRPATARAVGDCVDGGGAEFWDGTSVGISGGGDGCDGSGGVVSGGGDGGSGGGARRPCGALHPRTSKEAAAISSEETSAISCEAERICVVQGSDVPCATAIRRGKNQCGDEEYHALLQFLPPGPDSMASFANHAFSLSEKMFREAEPNKNRCFRNVENGVFLHSDFDGRSGVFFFNFVSVTLARQGEFKAHLEIAIKEIIEGT